MEKLLVIADPMDHPPIAIEKALSLAKYNDCAIHVLIFCYVSLTNYADTVEGGEHILKERILADQNKKWTEVISKFHGDSLITFDLLWEKDLSTFVLLHCKDKHYDLIIKTGHRSESLLHTPSDWFLLRESSFPVYIASPDNIKTKPIVLAAIDILSKSEKKQILNRLVMESAFRLAIHTNSVLHACFSIKIPTLIRDMDWIDVPRKTHELETAAREQASPLLEEYQVNSEHLHINDGDPSRVIAQIANRLSANCTVFGTSGRTGVTGKIIGNTCEASLHYLKGDQLVVSIK